MASRSVGLSLILTPDAMPVAEGRVVAGRYRVLERIGAGMLGLVVLAEDRQTGRHVALKILMPRMTDDAADPHGQRTMLSVAEDAASIRHPGAVTVVGTYVERVAGGPSVIVVMEHLTTPSLKTTLQTRGTMSAPEALRIIDAVSDVVIAAHARNILHLDLKPSNIFPRQNVEDGQSPVVVTDFGLVSGARQRSDRQLGLMGELEWSAPEVMQRGGVDARADVYSLGALLEEMLGSLDEAPSSGPHQALHRALLHVADIATHAQPAERYATVADFRAALHQDASELVTSAPARQPMGAAVWWAMGGALVLCPLLLLTAAAILFPNVWYEWSGVQKPEFTQTVSAAPAALVAPTAHEPTSEPTAIPSSASGASAGGPVVPPVMHQVVPAPSPVILHTTVTSRPTNTEVWLDGRLLGVTPYELPLVEGTRANVTLRRTGFVAKTMEVAAGAPIGNVQLNRVAAAPVTPRARPEAPPADVPIAKDLILER